MQNTGKTAHLRTRPVFELLVPVVHDPALPAIVSGIGGGEGGVEQALLLALRAELKGHGDEGVKGRGGWGMGGPMEVRKGGDGGVCEQEGEEGDGAEGKEVGTGHGFERKLIRWSLSP